MTLNHLVVGGCVMTKNTSTSLGDRFEGSVDQLIESGRYGSTSDVVRLENHERQVAALRQAFK